jgi:hypothetical protein
MIVGGHVRHQVSKLAQLITDSQQILVPNIRRADKSLMLTNLVQVMVRNDKGRSWLRDNQSLVDTIVTRASAASKEGFKAKLDRMKSAGSSDQRSFAENQLSLLNL